MLRYVLEIYTSIHTLLQFKTNEDKFRNAKCKVTFGVKKVRVDKDQEKVQSEKVSHTKNRGGKNKPTIRY